MLLTQAESGRVRTLPPQEGRYPGVYDTTAVLERPIGMRLVPSLSLVCRAEVLSLATQVEANVEVHEHSGSAPLFLLNTGETQLGTLSFLQVELSFQCELRLSRSWCLSSDFQVTNGPNVK